AAAMAFRFWGVPHADPQQFAPLIERPPGRRAGIADTVLVGAIEQRGWRTDRSVDSLAALRSRLDARQPVITLLADKRDSYHYVVVGAADEEAVVVHDPSWGPLRRLRLADFQRLWAPSEHWSLVVLPGGALPGLAADRSDAGRVSPRTDSCDPLMTVAIEK